MRTPGRDLSRRTTSHRTPQSFTLRRTKISNLNAAVRLTSTNVDARIRTRRSRSRLSIRLRNGMISVKICSIQAIQPCLQRAIKVGARSVSCLVLIRREPESSPIMSPWATLMPYVSARRSYVRYGCGRNNYCDSGDCVARASRVKRVSET
jgi:hypothetical protein